MSERVVVSRMMVGICHMQVCAVADATNEEILEVCNRENPSGTTHGWSSVVRGNENEGMGPVVCGDDPGRVHFLVAC